MGNAGILGLAHIGIQTHDLEKSMIFYQDILGFTFNCYQYLGQAPNQTKFAFLTLGSLIVELVEPPDKTDLSTRKDGIVDHFAMAVKNIDVMISALRAKGVQFAGKEPNNLPDFYNGTRCIFFRGPSNESIELFENNLNVNENA